MSAHGHTTDDEMHELNYEADYLDQKSPKRVNGRHNREHSDPDAQAMVIESLRSQIQDLFSQVTQLNSKLVKSYDRVSDLEDELHVASANLRSSTLKVSNLELERTQHLSALSTGLLVEKDHVTTELTRLMEKATEEAARRGQAESARMAIEKDLDDLSAGLFDQANRMVAEARFGRAVSERKAEETEQALRSAEEVVGVLQAQMQALQSEKEQSERQMREMQAVMGKGKWVSRPSARSVQLRHLSSHLPYHEFLQFIAHLRSLHLSTPQVPSVTTLLPLPFLARLVSEDSDPTVRLDLAPSLNWLTRRSVISAIHSGQLTVEPMSTTTLLEELTPPSIPTATHNTHVNCALCGSAIFELPSTYVSSRQSAPQSPGRNGSWSSAFKSSLQTIATAANSATGTRHTTPNAPTETPTQVYIFRLAATSSSGLPVSLPISPQQTGGQNRPTIYPLCVSGWCLTRLRTTCILWAFVRTSIVEKVWEEEPIATLPSTESHRPSALGSLTKSISLSSSDSPSAIPAKKSRMGIGAIWGSMQRGLSGTKGDESPKSVTSKPEDPPTPPPREKRDPPKSPPARRLPPPPPRHPPLSQPIPAPTTPTSSGHARTSSSDAPPPLPPRHSTTAPPPLPKRNRTRESRPDRAEVTPPPPAYEEKVDEAKESEEATPDEEAEETARHLNPSVELKRSESHETHDSFSTPTEGLSPSRPSSPATIPLPASGPSTPVATDFADDPSATDHGESHRDTEGTKSPEELSPPAQHPTPLTPATPEQAKTDSPSPSATSGVPPPLPRRAAARARPISVAAVPTPETSPEIPSPPAPGAVEDKKSGDEEEEKPAESDVQTGSSSEGTQSTNNTPPLPTRDQTPEISAAVTPASGLTGSDVSLAKMEEVELSTPPEQLDEESGSLKRHDDDDEDGAVLVNDSDHDRSPSPVDAGTSRDHGRFVGTPELDEETPFTDIPEENEEEEEEEIQGSFVGDASWEERTWKELTRLREDMFYARMGCVR